MINTDTVLAWRKVGKPFKLTYFEIKAVGQLIFQYHKNPGFPIYPGYDDIEEYIIQKFKNTLIIPANYPIHYAPYSVDRSVEKSSCIAAIPPGGIVAIPLIAFI